MIASATLRRNAASGVKQISTGGTLLSFLYSTRTIRGHQYGKTAEISFGDAPRPQRRERNAAGSQMGPPRRRNNASLGQPHGGRRPRPPRNGERSAPRLPRDGSSGYGNDRPSFRERQKATREDHIPFERPADEKAAVKDLGNDIVDGSTVTPSERKAFEELLGLKRHKQADGKGNKDKVDSSSAGPAASQIPGKDSREMPQALNQLLSDQETEPSLSQKSAPGSDLSLDKAIASDISRVDSLMADAQTDVDLWRVLHEQVISRVLVLGLDAPEATRSKKAPNEAAKKTPDSSQSKKTSPQDLQVLTQTFPKHLLNFTTRCNASFQGSHLPTTLLPYIKSLGPATFALAATTDLYNKHMRALYYNHQDLSAIVATLEEMEQQVYEFDIVTFDLLGKILRKATQAQEGKLGEGVKAVWGGERGRSMVRKIHGWSRKIERGIQEKALREARDREGEGEDEVERGGVEA